MATHANLGLPGGWTVVTFAADAEGLAALSALRGRFPTVRMMAVVGSAALADSAGADLPVLVDQGGRLAASLGVRGTRSFILDARGGIAHGWDGVPEHEAVAVYVARPPAPSGAPAWLFPVLATLVLLAGIGSWTLTHQPAPVASYTVAPSPVVAGGVGGDEAGSAESEAEGGDAERGPAEGGAADAGGENADRSGGDQAAAAAGAAAARVGTAEDVAPNRRESAGAGGKAGRATPGARGAGGWVFIPKEANGKQANVAGDVLTLTAGGAAVTACRLPDDLDAGARATLSWKAAGLSGGAKATVRQLDGAGKPVKDKGATDALGRVKGTADWQTLTTPVKAVPGASQARICVEVGPGTGTLQVKDAQVGG